MNRSANAAIKGYIYQFDKTILELLKLKNSESVVVEHTEDIDTVEQNVTTLIQCKYYPKTPFNPSSLGKDISQMFQHFLINMNENFKYNLYITSKTKEKDVAEIEELREYILQGIKKNVPIENSKLTTENLNAFLKRFTVEQGPEFEEQRTQIFRLLKDDITDCKDLEETELFYYNNALSVITSLAIEEKSENRKITKKDFINKINTKQILYNKWLIQINGKDKYLKIFSNEFKKFEVMKNTKHRYILIGNNILHNLQHFPLNQFVKNLLDKYYRLGMAYKGTRPLTLILDATKKEIKLLKKELLSKNIFYNDGFESISFRSGYFWRDNIHLLNSTKNKITDSCYQLRIISYELYKNAISHPHKVDSFLIFSNNTNNSFNKIREEKAPYIINIPYCEDLKDIWKILQDGGK